MTAYCPQAVGMALKPKGSNVAKMIKDDDFDG
jgi:hypothetical protein